LYPRHQSRQTLRPVASIATLPRPELLENQIGPEDRPEMAAAIAREVLRPSGSERRAVEGKWGRQNTLKACVAAQGRHRAAARTGRHRDQTFTAARPCRGCARGVVDLWHSSPTAEADRWSTRQRRARNSRAWSTPPRCPDWNRYHPRIAGASFDLTNQVVVWQLDFSTRGKCRT
jgi:hypothetical protein